MMTKSIYATAKESASVMNPDTRTNAEKILYELQKEQTNGFEMGHDVDNGAIALKLIEQNAELLAHLKFAVKLLSHFGHTAQVQSMQDTIAKVTGGAA